MSVKKIALSLVPLLLLPLLASAQLSHEETVVRNAYAKLAYAVQSHTVYDEAVKNPDLTTPELAKAVQLNQLRFEITEMSSGPLWEIASKPYSDFVTLSSTQDVLKIVHDEETVSVNNKPIAVSNFAVPSWMAGHSVSLPEREASDTSVNGVLVMAGQEGKFSRYVAATITVRYQGRSRTYHALWFFGSEVLGADPVSGDPAQYLSENVFPSVLTDTHLRSVPAVHEWLTSTQRYEASCKSGKQEICCDAEAMQCGVAADDMRTRPIRSLQYELELTAPKEKVQ